MKKFVVLLCTAVFTSVVPLQSKAAEWFQSQEAGFAISRPDEWYFVSPEESRRNLRALRLQGGAFDKYAAKYASDPLVELSKYREPFGDINPSIKVNIHPLGRFKDKPPVDILQVLVPQLTGLLGDFTLVKEPRGVKVSGLRGAYMRFDYTLQVEAGQSFEASTEMWAVPRGDHFFLLVSGTRKDERTGSRREIDRIIDSVRIYP